MCASKNTQVVKKYVNNMYIEAFLTLESLSVNKKT